MPKFTIRLAKREDCGEIRRLIQELADFEKMPDGPKINVSVLEKDGFDSDPPFYYCYVAHEAGDSEEVVSNELKDTTHEENSETLASVACDSINSRPLIGYALYYFTYSTWNGKSVYMEDLYVTPKWRKQKLGKALITTVAKNCYNLGCKRLDFSVLSWNPATHFYKSLGAIDLTDEENWHLFRVTGDALEKIALSKD